LQTDKFEASLSDEGRYRMLVEAVTDYAIYMLDPKGIVSSWNPGARRFKGEPSEIIGKHFRISIRRRQSFRNSAAGPRNCAREGKFESEAGASERRHQVLGLRHYRPHPRQYRKASRLANEPAI
jgi:PAS domain-containing protein